MAKRKVLIPLDGSEFSRQIVPVVRNFFDPKDVVMVLFRAAFSPAVSSDLLAQDSYIGGMPMAGSFDNYNRSIESGYAALEQEREAYRAELQEALRVEADRLRAAGYTVTSEVQFGDPAQRIIEYANDADVQLVAMATHGRTGLGRLVLGSVAERVLRGVTVPVLLMRTAQVDEADDTPGDLLSRSLGNGHSLNLSVATDGSTHGQHAVDVAAALSTALQTELQLIVTTSGRDGAAQAQKLMEETCRRVADLQPRPQAVPLVGYADEELLQYTAKNSVDLLIIGAFQDRGAGSAAAIGPTAQRIVQHASTSVLVVKGRKREFRTILACVAIDDMVAVDVAAQLAKATNAELQLVHVVPPSAASYLASADSPNIDLDDVLSQETRLSEVVKAWLVKLENRGFGRQNIMLRRGNVPEAILDIAHEFNHDLVVVGSQSGPGHFLGSVSNAVVRFAEQSVLIVRTRTQ
ncbi:MAG: universal stress protein [Caldilineaceae bacterium]|nr:universal stress protein [Caldilineaceae bacterium]